MIVVAFLTFAILLVAWLMASNGEVKAEALTTANLKMGDARA